MSWGQTGNQFWIDMPLRHNVPRSLKNIGMAWYEKEAHGVRVSYGNSTSGQMNHGTQPYHFDLTFGDVLDWRGVGVWREE